MEIDVHLGGSWQACARLTPPGEGEDLTFRYDADYALRALEACDNRAASVRLPVDLGVRRRSRWPSFLYDLLPGRAAQAALRRSLDGPLDDWLLLAMGATNPAGNLRVRPRESRAKGSHAGFTLEQLIAQGDNFIDAAREAGAAVAGATDVQGESPKFWIIETAEGRWLPDDGRQGTIVVRHALLKFPAPQAGTHATDMLRLEAAYQRVARRLGLSVGSVLPHFAAGALLSARFDRRVESGREVRLGVESLCSVAGVSPREPLGHCDALLALHGCLSDFDGGLREYLRRDLLNLAMGNRDNHGRNTAVLKDTDGSVRLAPLYDFGPAYLDERPRGRAMRWDGEGTGMVNWCGILTNLAGRFARHGRTLGDLRMIAADLREFSGDLARLPELMLECGVDDWVVRQRRPAIAILHRALGALGCP